MTQEDIRDAFAAIKGIQLIEYTIAPGIGYHHFTFKADEPTLERLVKALKEIRYLNTVITVNYNDGLVYRLSRPGSHLVTFIECLKSLH